ncbi:hypothetical protein ANCCEY_09757 [Ancylostoma ceylanicum]|uniref:Reverse transcriptase domain-containing protein n=1 Tax=Ancylostoma ceylanicum TaxID=53326 RepID=A0A0D6LM70_9BILA|nr:hypothetical protein ANCCEY_09757 [Ancylostoma ceylanicum]
MVKKRSQSLNNRTGYVDQGKNVDVIYLDYAKAFDRTEVNDHSAIADVVFYGYLKARCIVLDVIL